MAKRRSNAEIAEVDAIHDRTRGIAQGISDAVNPTEDEPYISVMAAPYWNYRADYQRDMADDLVVSFTTKDPALAAKVAVAIRNAVGNTQP